MNFKKLLKLFTVKETYSGAKITIFDELKPEESAMVQSLNSRSAGGFWINLMKVTKEGAEKFMSAFYSGYGHKSIADCGSTSATFDGISMLAAKEIQNWWAYNGQETSTRYIDTTELGYIDPLGTEVSKRIVEKWFAFYIKAIEPLKEHLRIVRPKKEDEDEEKYEKMIFTRTCDILGSFLPAGAKTNASCHMELRQWDDKLSWMKYHPLVEISQIANATLEGMIERYESTFKRKPTRNDAELIARGKREEYRLSSRETVAYQHVSDYESIEIYQKATRGFKFMVNFLHDSFLKGIYRELVESRPEKVEIPKIVNECGSFRIQFLIDFRSHRDLQRQRSALQRVPLLTTEIGFEQWYLDQLPEYLRIEALDLIKEQCAEIESLDCDKFTKQYYIAMGFKVLDTFTVSLSDLIYIIELRTPTTVHPTARAIALKMYRSLKVNLPDFVKIYANESEDDLDIKRADQDLFIGDKRLSEK
jgi:thymidylate synthase ThyX